jgi:hypothetical protein
VKTGVADDHDRHGTRTMGLGQFVAANEAICNDKTSLHKNLYLSSLFTYKENWNVFAILCLADKTMNILPKPHGLQAPLQPLTFIHCSSLLRHSPVGHALP